MRRSLSAIILFLMVSAMLFGLTGTASADTWTFTGLGGTSSSPLSITSGGGSVYVGMGDGHVWRKTGAGVWTDLGTVGSAVTAMTYGSFDDTGLYTAYAGTQDGNVWIYTSSGWDWVGMPYMNSQVNSLTVTSGTFYNVYAGSSNGHVYWFKGNDSWQDVLNAGSSVLSVWYGTNYCFAGCANSTVYCGAGTSWTNYGACNTTDPYVLISPTIGLIAAGYNSRTWQYAGGTTWNDIGKNIGSGTVTGLINYGGTTYASNVIGQVFYYDGASWVQCVPWQGFWDRINGMATDGTNLYACFASGRVISYASGVTTDIWPTRGAKVNALGLLGDAWAGCQNGQVYYYDNGWVPIGTNRGSPVLSMQASGTRMYAGCDDGNVYYFNSGSWVQIPETLSSSVYSLAWDGTCIYAGCLNGHVYYCIEGVWTWNDLGLIGSGGAVYSICVNGGDVYTANSNGEVYRYTWPDPPVNTGLATVSGAQVTSLCWLGSTLYAAAHDGHVYSYDGDTWTIIQTLGTAQCVETVATDGNALFGGTMDGYLLRYMGDTTWIHSGSMARASIETMCWSQQYMWTGSSAGAWRGELLVTPAMTTDPASSVESDGATLNGRITWNGGENADTRGFRYRKAGASAWTEWTEAGSFGAGTFSRPVTGLEPLTDYEFEAMAHNSVGCRYGSAATFNTLAPPPPPPPPPPPALGAWYLAEGTNAWGFSTYITIENPYDVTTQAKVTYMDVNRPAAGKGVLKVRDVTLPPLSQTTISSMSDIGDVDFSTKIECPKTIAVDRTMFWTGAGAAAPGYHSSIGSITPACTWYLPEGSSGWGFETWTALLNPGSTTATVKLTYMTADGPIVKEKSLAAHCRGTYNMAVDIGVADASIKVESDQPVVAERSMYRGNRPRRLLLDRRDGPVKGLLPCGRRGGV